MPAYRLQVSVVHTNKVPVATVRGAGYPQAAFVMERMLDRIAQGVGIDRAECRRRNLIPADRIPYVKPLKSRAGVPLTIDSGDFPALQARALAEIGYAEFDARRREAAARGLCRGIGLANGVKPTGRGRSSPRGSVSRRPDRYWVLGTLIIALIIFVETGLVIMPFLPGDSLLFAAGAFLRLAGIDPLTSIAIITAAAISGARSTTRSVLPAGAEAGAQPMDQARAHGARAGILRALRRHDDHRRPLRAHRARTLAPFVAGLSQMPRGRFYAYNVVGGVVWCSSMMLAGYWLGSIPWVGPTCIGSRSSSSACR